VNNFRAEPSIKPEEIVRELLRANQIVDPPTDAQIIAAYLNLRIEEHNDGQHGLPPSIRAYIIPEKRLIGIHRNLTAKQRNFSILHEIGHFVLPGHSTHPDLVKEDGIIADEGKNLSASSTIRAEIEANQFAADCLFQLERFDLRVRTEELSWDSIKSTANDYNASYEATVRRWVERSDQECALVVFNPANRRKEDTPLEIMYTITSSSFRDSYFERLVPGHEMGSGTLVYELFHRLVSSDKTHEQALFVNIAGKNTHEFCMKLFSNSYRVFGLLTPIKD
jgi:Zn-dependent peptidase ImmA (M78 family)